MDRRTRHYGDCWWYAVKICTCGYLHDIYPPEENEKLTPEQEKQHGQHDYNLAILNSMEFEGKLWPPEYPPKRTPEEQKEIDDLARKLFGREF